MIKVYFTMTPDGAYDSFKIEGHAAFDEPGKDLVCAGVSAIAYGAVNSILSLTSCEPNISIEEGFMHVTQLCDNEDTQLLVKGLEISLITVENDYGEYIRITKQ